LIASRDLGGEPRLADLSIALEDIRDLGEQRCRLSLTDTRQFSVDTRVTRSWLAAGYDDPAVALTTAPVERGPVVRGAGADTAVARYGAAEDQGTVSARRFGDANGDRGTLPETIPGS
jgi:hypothetical protein